MPQTNWTPSQKDAIQARDGTILVSAAAGSGKTAVLSERVLQILSDETHPVPADRLLIVTFSNAAAAEMKERIEQKLSSLIGEQPESLFLQQQQINLQNTAISTIHAFCFDLIRTNFQQLSLSADLRIADEKELGLLRREILEELISTRFEQADPMFLKTVELFSTTRNDEPFFRTIFRLYDFTRVHPFPEKWLEKSLQRYSRSTAIEGTVWGSVILKYATDALRFCQEELKKALSIMEGDEKLICAYQPSYFHDLQQLAPIIAAVENKEWDKAVSLLKAYSFQKLKPLRGYEDDDKKKAVSDIRKSVKTTLDKLRDKQLCAFADEAMEDIEDLAPKISILFNLVNEFSNLYERVKAERQILDFSDLEQYTVRLLFQPGLDGEAVLTPLAMELQGSYDYILVDEYQDTNEVQEMIFSALSNGKNLFMVGDVKQSIYGFRLANPQIFMHKKDVFCPYNALDYPAKITLGANFRSHPKICEAINIFFHAVMTRNVGGVDYTCDEELIPMGSFPETSSAGMALELLDTTDSEIQPIEQEAAYVAKRIARLLESRQMVSSGGCCRPIQAGDICILLRSPKGRSEYYLKALAQRGIRALSGTQSSYLHTTEISTAVSLLKAINNPLWDIPLVSAMMSPVYAYSPSTIARIRLYKRDAPYYFALLEGEAQGDSDCTRFLKDLAAYRRQAAHCSTARLLRSLYDTTALLSIVSAMDNSMVRKANLNLLIQYAKHAEKSGLQTLSQFLRYLDRLEENGDDLVPANLSGLNCDQVQIMSIHHSKGLEFPVVFLCDCAKLFNREEQRQNALLHAQLGFACVRRDENTMSQYTTVPLEAVKLTMNQENAGEELRVLYVAMTRAKESLIVTAALPSLARRISALDIPVSSQGILPSHAVAHAQSYLDWFLMVALNCAGENLRQYAGLYQKNTAMGSNFSCDIIRCSRDLDGIEINPDKEAMTAPPSQKIIDDIHLYLSRKYPYRAAAQIPTKLAVTSIEKKDGEQQRVFLFSKKPQFITHQKYSAAMRGDALHKYMLFANHSLAQQNAKQEIGRLIQKAFLSPEEGEMLSAAQITSFYQSKLYKRMMASSHVEREFRFMTQLGKDTLSHLFADMGEETVTVQGICDLLFYEGDDIILVDYKTDNTDSADLLIEKYKGQLYWYAAMIEKILGARVKEGILYSTALSAEITVFRKDGT